MQIERMENESKFDYHRRLVYGKLVDKTLADVDYSELSELVYGQPYSSDVARRMLYGSRRTLELMDEERAAGGGSSAYTDEIDASTLWVLHEVFGFGRDRLRRFHYNFNAVIDSLCERYELTDNGDDLWLCTHKLKNELDIDIRAWNEGKYD